MAKIRISPRVTGWVLAGVARLLGRTLRFSIDDRVGMCEQPGPANRMIWLCWHNRLLLTAIVHWSRFAYRKGAVLTSASSDGEIFAQTCRHLGVDAARGSSSRRKVAAIRESLALLNAGYDLGMTPDGPRGPRYHFQPGALMLAQKSGASLLPIHFRPARYWRLKTWDGFVVPKPFSRVDVVIGPPVELQPTKTPEQFEAERARVEQILRDGTGE